MGQQEIISWWMKTKPKQPLTWKELRKGIVKMYGAELCSESSNAMYKLVRHGIFSQTTDFQPKYYMRIQDKM